MAKEILLRSERIELLDPASVEKQLSRLIGAAGPVRALDSELSQRGYRPLRGADSVMGYRESLELVAPLKLARAPGGKPLRQIEFTMNVKSYGKAGSKDRAALVQVSIRGGGEAESYEMILEAPAGDFEKATEFKVGRNLKVQRANSWWSRMKACLIDQCGKTCRDALVGCTAATWAGYLKCVALVCGGCFVRCSACATCNCKWWCKRVVRCCR